MKTSAKHVVTDALLADRLALDAAITIARKSERARELGILIWELGWDEAARIAAYDCQSRALRLPHWSEEVPCRASLHGRSRASRLLRRMLKRGISRFHPRPLEAIAEAGGGADEKGLSIIETPGASSAA
jgi:hypothetical protein